MEEWTAGQARAMEREESVALVHGGTLGAKPFMCVHSGEDVAEVWAHGPVVRYRYGGPHPSGLNRHERRKRYAQAR
jgi:hypothetical protein